LDALGTKVKGKIVCFNNEWTTYGDSVEYRVKGASYAAKYGAAAVLVRSVTPESIYSVHAGIMHYDPNYPKIPVAAITVEDAEMFQRMQERGQRIVVHLILENKSVDGAYSNNIIFEIKGA
jgi:carboxypeptidase Q